MVSVSALALDVDKLHRDWEWMLGELRQVLQQSGDAALADLLPNATSELEVDGEQAGSVQLTQAYSIAFQLLSMAEQISAAHFRTQIENDAGLDQLTALWGECFRSLKESGLSDVEIATRLPEIQVELVLTAHPTEAKRATVLAHHRRLFNRFVHRDRTEMAPWQKAENQVAIRSLIAVLWRTGEIYLEKPDIQSERRNVVDYLTHVFPAALRTLDFRLRQAWEQVGLNPALLRDPLSLPRLTFGTWVGGDRDGHPLVTPTVTSDTLHELRHSAIELTRRQLTELAKLISLSAYWLAPNSDFLQHIAQRVESLGVIGRKAIERNPNEPWRQFLNLMLARLPVAKRTHTDSESELSMASSSYYQQSEELLGDLRVLYDALDAVSMRQVADFCVAPVMRIVQAFGFHLAVLDIRQNSATHELAIEQLLVASGVVDSGYTQWSEEKRVAFLIDELNSPRPFALAGKSIGREADAVLGALRVAQRHLEAHGPDGLGALIVSMTRRPSDLLCMYLLAREVGLLIDTKEGLVCPLPVVPLFETIEDLQGSGTVYERFLQHPITQRSLAYLQRTKKQLTPTGQIMIGYSDSNKDGGIMASLVELRNGQKRLTQIGKKYGVRIRFFHGRGGTISRGAGPTHRFVRALPNHTLGGDLRLTEQGETIAQKYAHQTSAIYNLEQFLAGVTRKTLSDLHVPSSDNPLEETLEFMADLAKKEYHQLLHSPGFIDFFRQATPIDAIEQSSIGSRPSRRSGQKTLADLRAIPWVFSWSQARFYLSGWYGVGTALSRLSTEQPDVFSRLKEQTTTWPPLHYIISNVATSIAAVDLSVARDYTSLVEDVELRERIFGLIDKEWNLTKHMIEMLYGGGLDSKRPNIQRMLDLRNNGLKILHAQQIRLLRRWRSYQRMGEMNHADELLPQLLLTVNAIAAGLGTTG
jgi:phosphoenolpyruvate carboxylase